MCMLGFAMPDPFAVVTAAATSIVGAFASFAKDRSDRASLRKDLAAVKAQVGEVVETIERLKARMKQGRSSVPDLNVADLQRQIDDVHEQHEKITRRLDEHAGQWTTVQRELGAIGAKIEILLSGPR